MAKKKNQTKENQPFKEEKKKSHSSLIMFIVVLIFTIGSLLFSFYGAGEGDIALGFNTVYSAVLSSDPIYLLIMTAVYFVSYVFDGLAIQVFCRLYTRHYYLHQGLANSLIGGFYNNVTPGSSGGQFMQVYTLKKQGVEVSNAASILVMWFIIYQIALIVFDVLALTFEWDTIMSITSFQIPNFSLFGWNGEIPMLPLIIIGFAFNVAIILLLLLMSYSHRFHNFIMHYIVGFLGKIHILKDPDKTRENLRVQVENFKVELKRLQANIPVTILVFVIFMIVLFLRFSVPYFAGMALNAYGAEEGFSFMRLTDACFRSAFHQMVAGLVPIPGAAGISELLYAAMFNDFFVETYSVTSSGLKMVRTASANMMTSQILWRFATFYLLLIVSGIVASLYHSKPHEAIKYASRQTFIDLQLANFDTTKMNFDTLYETKQLSRKTIRRRLTQDSKNWGLLTGDDYVGFHFSKKGEIGKKKSKAKNSPSVLD